MQNGGHSDRRGDVGPTPLRVAQYVRMSTDHQRYSTENQAEIIGRYALDRGMTIVRTYADEGKSGLNIEGRDALRQLIEDVERGPPGFEAVLVYDVSRWGRFQDQDESAYYEYRCRRAGIQIHYCAEQFENDGTPFAALAKSFKRSMAGEYSRELSTKVFIGQCRLIELGFRQGGPAGFGLRRLLVDERGEAKGELTRGQHKSLQTDRVILVPGPPDEIEIVNRMYRWFVEDKLPEARIAALLNQQGCSTDLGRPWTRGTVHQVLTNEKYVGSNVFNRTSFKLKKHRVRNEEDKWVRSDGAFAPIVPHALFAAARLMVEERSQKFSDDELLQKLAALLQAEGELSGLMIDEREDLPSSSAYRHRFGSLLRAYSLVGFRPRRDYRYLETNRVLRELHAGLVDEILVGLASGGGDVTRDTSNDLLLVNGEFTLSLVIARCTRTQAGSHRWKIRFDTSLHPDLTLAVRMDASNSRPLDFYLLPAIDMTTPNLRLAAENGVSLDAYRFEDLTPLYTLSARAPLREAA